MTEPIVCDARGGLTRQVLDDLRQAEWLLLAIRRSYRGVREQWNPEFANV